MANQQTNRKKKNKDNAETNRIIAQWGITLAILLVVISVLVTNFMIVSKNSAKENVNKEMLSSIQAVADESANTMKTLTTVGNVVASYINEERIEDKSILEKMASNLPFIVESLDLAVIVDADGKGVASDRKDEVDVSGEDYYDGSLMQSYYIVDSSSILGKDGMVTSIPIKDGNRFIGSIYLFTSMNKLMSATPIEGSMVKPSYALMDSNGKIVNNWGEESGLVSEGDFLEAISSSTLYDTTISKLKMRLSKNSQIAFQSGLADAKETVLIVPMGINDWKYVVAVNQQYVDQMVDLDAKVAHNMVRNLAVAICAVMIIIMLISAINKYKYNEENKDLSNKADTDLLTGVNNKIATERKIKEFIEENPDTQSIMLLFDVDNFKKINDTMGHAFGDEVLKTIGHGLSNEFRATDIIGRIGGDEFVLFLKNLKTDELVEKEGSRVADFFKNFKAGDYVKYSATASIGACVFPRDGESFEELYRACDNALYEAKRQGKNRLVYYSKKMSGNTELRDQEAKNNPGART